MSILDKVIAAVTPPESDQARAEARARARAAASNSPWLTMVLDHHLQIEAAFTAVRQAGDAATRRACEKRLGALLTGHSLAEEAVLYPALALSNQEGHATKAYTEQSAAKIQMAALETLEPMSQDYLDKLEHIRGAVAHHVYEEEGEWFPALTTRDAPTQARLTVRYREEYERYMGAETLRL